MHWRRQGDLGELSAMEWFASKGAAIAVPLGHSPDWDFIAELGDKLVRVQVKTSISAPGAGTSSFRPAAATGAGRAP
jgi:hypothetical protein